MAKHNPTEDRRRLNIKKAIKRPGQLHRDLGVSQGEKIPQAKLQAAMAGQMGKKTAQRAQFAKTLSGFRK